jgi:hypothetical protein
VRKTGDKAKIRAATEQVRVTRQRLGADLRQLQQDRQALEKLHNPGKAHARATQERVRAERAKLRAEQARARAERAAAAKKADELTQARREEQARQRAERRSVDTAERDRINAEKEQRRKEQKEARAQLEARQEKARQEKRQKAESEKKPPPGSLESFLKSMNEAAAAGGTAKGRGQDGPEGGLTERDDP